MLKSKKKEEEREKPSMMDYLFARINEEERASMPKEKGSLEGLPTDQLVGIAADMSQEALVYMRNESWHNPDEKDNVVIGGLADAIHNVPIYIQKQDRQNLINDIARYNCLMKIIKE